MRQNRRKRTEPIVARRATAAEIATDTQLMANTQNYYKELMDTFDALPKVIREAYHDVPIDVHQIIFGTAEDLWSRGYSTTMSLQKLETWKRMHLAQIESERRTWLQSPTTPSASRPAGSPAPSTSSEPLPGKSGQQSR